MQNKLHANETNDSLAKNCLELVTSYKGIYHGNTVTKYFDPDTGAHFRYEDMCKLLEQLKSARQVEAMKESNSTIKYNERSVTFPEDTAFIEPPTAPKAAAQKKVSHFKAASLTKIQKQPNALPKVQKVAETRPAVESFITFQRANLTKVAMKQANKLKKFFPKEITPRKERMSSTTNISKNRGVAVNKTSDASSHRSSSKGNQDLPFNQYRTFQNTQYFFTVPN